MVIVNFHLIVVSLTYHKLLSVMILPFPNIHIILIPYIDKSSLLWNLLLQLVLILDLLLFLLDIIIVIRIRLFRAFINT